MNRNVSRKGVFMAFDGRGGDQGVVLEQKGRRLGTLA